VKRYNLHHEVHGATAPRGGFDVDRHLRPLGAARGPGGGRRLPGRALLRTTSTVSSSTSTAASWLRS